MARPSAASAASFTASFSVGCAWQMRAEILGRAAELHQHRCLGDHGAGVGAEDMHAEHAVGRRIGQHLDEAFRGAVDLGAAVGGEGKLADLVGDAGLLQLLLGLADRSNLRRGIDHARDHVVIHVTRLPGQDLGDGDAFVLGLMRQHRPGNDIADGVDAGHVRRIMRIDLDAPAIVGLHADARPGQALACSARVRPRPAPRRSPRSRPRRPSQARSGPCRRCRRSRRQAPWCRA